MHVRACVREFLVCAIHCPYQVLPPAALPAPPPQGHELFLSGELGLMTHEDDRSGGRGEMVRKR